MAVASNAALGLLSTWGIVPAVVQRDKRRTTLWSR